MGLLIDMISVGQGDSFLLTVDGPQGEAYILIDAGLLGGATIASLATAEPGPLVLATGLMTGTSLSVRGTTNILGAATNTNVNEADKVLAATANPAGLVATVASKGNLDVGRVAATAQSVGMAVNGVVQNPQSLSSPATVAKNTNLAVNTAQLASQLSTSTNNASSPPPPPKPPSPPACALDKGGCH